MQHGSYIFHHWRRYRRSSPETIPRILRRIKTKVFVPTVEIYPRVCRRYCTWPNNALTRRPRLPTIFACRLRNCGLRRAGFRSSALFIAVSVIINALSQLIIADVPLQFVVKRTSYPPTLINFELHPQCIASAV